MLPAISICICTYKRPAMLERLLRDLARQETENCLSFSVVVADNDAAESARPVVDRLRSELGVEICYTVEPRRNIAHARNAAVAQARGDFIAFIDDDEFPEPDWLLNLYRTCEKYQVAGVLGPVKPHFEKDTPTWVIKGGFYNRPEHETGFEMTWPECRTGNVLLRSSVLRSGGASVDSGRGTVDSGRRTVDGGQPSKTADHQQSTINNQPFREEFGTGGEDQDFFRRMTELGHRFIWCNEAVAWETVPLNRCSRRFMLNRAMLRGRNSLRHGKHRIRNLCKSAVAIPAYLVALPVLLLCGQHLFMKYCVKLTDHTGRVLAVIGLNRASERPM